LGLGLGLQGYRVIGRVGLVGQLAAHGLAHEERDGDRALDLGRVRVRVRLGLGLGLGLGSGL